MHDSVRNEPIALDAPRLKLRALRASDAEFLLALRSDPEVARYQSWSEFGPEDAARMIAVSSQSRLLTPGRWHQLGIATREGDRLVGDLAFHFPSPAPDQTEIGFNIARLHWGKGYGQEAVGRLADWLREERNVRRIFAVVDERNHACRRLLDKTGFQPAPDGWRLVFFKGEWAGEMVYERFL
ncbi:MAG: GNAT family N-acetyltransferase [Acidobacteria bacterium]|nr:GNAT family N-acetyltransferase [Acidobacteriota bacterium]